MAYIDSIINPPTFSYSITVLVIILVRHWAVITISSCHSGTSHFSRWLLPAKGTARCWRYLQILFRFWFRGYSWIWLWEITVHIYQKLLRAIKINADNYWLPPLSISTMWGGPLYIQLHQTWSQLFQNTGWSTLVLTPSNYWWHTFITGCNLWPHRVELVPQWKGIVLSTQRDQGNSLPCVLW